MQHLQSGFLLYLVFATRRPLPFKARDLLAKLTFKIQSQSQNPDRIFGNPSDISTKHNNSKTRPSNQTFHRRSQEFSQQLLCLHPFSVSLSLSFFLLRRPNSFPNHNKLEGSFITCINSTFQTFVSFSFCN